MLLSLYVLFVPKTPAGTGFAGEDKLVHLVLFAALAATARLRFGAGVGVPAVLVAYAVGSEVVQAVGLPDRGGDPLDVVADLAGIGLGWLAVSRVGAARRRVA